MILKSLKFALYISCILGQASLTSCVWSSSVSRDFLSNWGNFENPATIITFNSSYIGKDYDYDAEGRWSQPYNGSRQGFCLPTKNDTLGNGWCRTTQLYVNPDKNMICKLVPGGVNNSSCQYVALKDLNSWGEVSVYSKVVISSQIDHTGSNLRPGDKLIFKIDNIKMTDFEGVNVRYILRITQNSTSGESTKSIDITPSKTPFSTLLEATVMPDVSKVFVSFSVSVDGGTKGKTPGMYVDGAHLHVTRANKTAVEMVEVPVKKNRTIKTMCIGWRPEKENDYSVAMSSDYVIAFCHRMGNYSSILRELNPNIRIYTYVASNIIRADAGPKDGWHGTSLGYIYASKNHPEWLYTDGISQDKYLSVSGYPDNYYSKRSDPAYQQAWVQDLLSKAKRNEFDGIFIDEADPYPRIPAGTELPLIQPYNGLVDCQQFLHATVPEMKAAGYDVVYNDINTPLTPGGAGRVLLYPIWTPDDIYSISKGYSANSETNVPRCRFKEWSFLKLANNNAPKNTYEKEFWLQTINYMDEVALWNTTPPLASLNSNRKAMLWIFTVGWDSAEDPAQGDDGWLSFSLCSYLIGQNSWTVFGYGVKSATTQPLPTIDYSVTAKLGIPSSPHTAVNGDQYFRVRTYKPSPDFPASKGGLVIVNANPNKSVQYILKINTTDLKGNLLKKGTLITLKPHTGRILLNTQAM